MPAHFGLDIGSYSIKLIQAKKEGTGFRLVTFGEVRTPADLNSEADKDKLAFIEAIKKLAEDCKVTTKKVALALSESEVYSQVIELPYLSETELASAINFEAEQYIPVPLEEVQLEYLVLKTPPKGAINEKMEVLLVGAKKKALEKIVEVIEKAGLTPITAETEILSLIRILPPDFAKIGLLLDLGFRSTDIAIVQDHNLRLVRTLNTGGEALTRAVATSLNMEFVQAEQYKVSYGIDESQLEGKVAKAIIPTFDVILEEIRRGLAFFSQREQDKKADLVILSGGGAEMPGLSSYLAKSLNLEVSIIDPFAKFIKDEEFPKIVGAPRFSVAAGLAIREDE